MEDSRIGDLASQCDGSPWVPVDGLRGLLEELYLLRRCGVTELPLAARPEKELVGNYHDHNGDSIDLRGLGQDAVVAAVQSAVQSGDEYMCAKQAAGLLSSLIPTADTFLIVTHHDYSHWALRRYSNEARDGFLCPAASGDDMMLPFVPYILDPARRGYVPRGLAIRTGKEPAIVAELSLRQTLLAREKLDASGRLQQEELDAVLETPQLAEEEAPLRLVLGFEERWPAWQTAVAGASFAAVSWGMLRGAATSEGGRSRLHGLLWSVFGLAAGFGASFGALTSTGVEVKASDVHPAVPCATLFSAASSIALLSANPKARIASLLAHSVSVFSAIYVHSHYFTLQSRLRDEATAAAAAAAVGA